MNDIYRQKLEKENQDLIQRIAEVEEENAKLLEELQKLDSNSKQEVMNEVDLTQVVAKSVVDDIEKEIFNDLLKQAEIARQKLQDYEDAMVKKKMNEPISPIIIPKHKNNI